MSEAALVLLYHGLDTAAQPTTLTDAADRSVVVDAEAFSQQLAKLTELGKSVIPFDRLFDQQPVPPGAVVITFDDGHVSNWSLALPALIEAGMTATFYVVAGFVDEDPEYVTTQQLRELDEAGMHIGSHGFTHRFLPDLSHDEMKRELSESKDRLEQLLGKPVLDLAIPGGHFNKTVLEESHRCGYRSVATCKVGAYSQGSDPYRMPRVEIRRQLSMEEFAETFDPAKLRQLQRLESMKTMLRSTLGLSNYTRLRSLAHRLTNLSR